MTERAICGCGATLGLKNTSGRCRSCAAKWVNSDPAIHAKRVAGIHRKFAEDPQFKAEHAARMVKNGSTPFALEQKRKRGVEQYKNVLSRPDVQERMLSAESRAKRGRTASATWLSWCPADRREEYRRLVRSKRIPAAEARAIIEAEVAGSQAAAKLEVANFQLQMRLRHERDLASRY